MAKIVLHPQTVKYQKFIRKLVDLQREAFDLGLPVTAKCLNIAQNEVGTEIGRKIK